MKNFRIIPSNKAHENLIKLVRRIEGSTMILIVNIFKVKAFNKTKLNESFELL